MMIGQRLVILKRMRRTVVTLLHAAHQGETRTLRRARQIVYWPNMTNDIRNAVRSCQACAMLLPSQPREPFLSDSHPTRPFEDTAADIFHHAGFKFLVWTDKYFGWPMVKRCGHSTSSQVIKALKEWSMEVGVPARLTTDGGLQFKSKEFLQFCEEWHITHNQGSPYNHRSNGEAEAAVKTIKHLVIKMTKTVTWTRTIFFKGMIELRNTPRESGLS